MSRLDTMLGQDETVLYRTRLHPIACCGGALLIAVLAGAGLVALLATALFGALPDPAQAGILGLALLLAGAIPLMVIRLVITTHEFAVTPRRLLATMGLVRTRTLDVSVTKVETLVIEQGLLGRMLGYGEVRIVGTGGTTEAFRGVRDPGGFRRALSEASDRLLQRGTGEGAVPAAGGPRPPAPGA